MMQLECMDQLAHVNFGTGLLMTAVDKPKYGCSIVKIVEICAVGIQVCTVASSAIEMLQQIKRFVHHDGEHRSLQAQWQLT